MLGRASNVPLTRTHKVVLALAGLEFLHYAVLATRGDPLNMGTLASLVVAMGGLGWVIASRRGIRLPPVSVRVRWLLACLALMVATGYLTAIGWMLAGAQSEADQPVDIVLVLGAGLRNGRPTPTLERRIDAAAAYLLQHPGALVMGCGGVGVGHPISEAEAIRDGLVARGIAPDRVLLENQSTTTAENLRFAHAMVSARAGKTNPRVLIATSNYHLARAKLLARRAGFVPFGLPASTPWYNLPNSATRESLAIVKALLTQ